MIIYMEAPTVLVYWRGRGTADAFDEAIAGHVEKDTMLSLSSGPNALMRGSLETQAGFYDRR